MSGTQEQLKKERQQEILRNMANEAEIYQQNVSSIVQPAIEDLDQLNQSKMLREQVTDMLITDVRAAGDLKEVYPDLVEEARRKEEKLNAQANAGAVQKIKTRDFFGSKKRRAKAKLRTIQSNKNILKRDREQKLYDHIKEKTEELKRQIAENGGSPEIEKDPNMLSNNGAYYDLTLKLISLTDREKTKTSKTDEFRNLKLYYSNENSTEPEPYVSNEVRRDIATLTTPFMHEEKADIETMKTFQEAFFILQSGKVVTKQGRPDATVEQKKEALYYLQGFVHDKYMAMKKFKEDNPNLFSDGARTEDLVDHLPEFMAWTNNQQISVLSRLVLSSAKELGMSPEYINELKEQRVDIVAFQKYFAPMNAFIKKCSVAADSGKPSSSNLESPTHLYSKQCEDARKELAGI